MSDHSTEDSVKSFYGQLDLPEARYAAIAEAADLAERARRWRTIAGASLAALAIMTLVTVYLLVSAGGDNARDAIADQQQQPELNERVPKVDTPEPRTPESPPTKKLQLVAFRSHGDGCPHCRETGEVFAQLQGRLNSVVETRAFDLRSEIDREKLKAAGLDSLAADRAETAFFTLLDPNGNTLQEFKPSQGPDFIIDRVQLAARKRIGQSDELN